ncbi:TipAS antibiotic-recognition domain-containing protein [Nonomuraea wenchangensis]
MAWSIAEVARISGVTSRSGCWNPPGRPPPLRGGSAAAAATDPGAAIHLGRMQFDDERFRENYERIADGLAAYMRDAMAAYAHARLS